MTSGKYFGGSQEHAAERERLGALEALMDPFTVKHLGALGITRGWNCLEVGAGGGSVARWMAEQVGPKGRVVATDIDPRFLHDLEVANLAVRHHDIVKDDLEEGVYDVVHSRILLLHLPGYEKALARMAAAVRPGGWLLIEEPDNGLSGPADPKHPAAETANRVYQAGAQFIQEKGIMDLYFGRRVRGLVERLGFVDVGHDVFVECYRGGEPNAKWAKMTGEALFRLCVAAGLVTEEDVAQFLSALDDPSYPVVGGAWFAAWGRRVK